MKLKRLRDETHADQTPRWIWQLVWCDPQTKREASERIGYFCNARDSWRPPGGKLVRLNEKEAKDAREKKVRELKAVQEGILIPATSDTRERWGGYCQRTGQPTGLAMERILQMMDAGAFRRFEETCRSFGLNAIDVHQQILTDWVERKESNPPSSWQALTEWFKSEGSPNAGYRTWQESKRTFDLFKELCPELAEKWQTLTRDDALIFHNRLSAKFESAMTVRKHLSNMRKLWRACKRTWVKCNPWSELNWPKMESDPDSWHYFPASEVKTLLGCADQTWKGRIRLAWKCGLRPGEIDHLRIADVDWQENRVKIRKHKSDDKTLAWVPKDKDARTIPVDAETMLELKKLKAKSPPGSPYLFVSEKRWRQALALQRAGKWRRDMELICGKKKAWNKIVDAAEIRPDDGPAIFYGLRKTCCCDLLTSGVPAHEVRLLMGHADLETTLRWYTKVNKKEAEARIRKAQGNAG